MVSGPGFWQGLFLSVVEDKLVISEFAPDEDVWALPGAGRSDECLLLAKEALEPFLHQIEEEYGVYALRFFGGGTAQLA